MFRVPALRGPACPCLRWWCLEGLQTRGQTLSWLPGPADLTWRHRGRHGAGFLPLPAPGAQEGQRKRVEMPRCPPGRRLAGVRVTQGVQKGPEKQGAGTTTWLMPGKCLPVLLGTWQLSPPEVLSAHFWGVGVQFVHVERVSLPDRTLQHPSSRCFPPGGFSSSIFTVLNT